MNLYSSSRLILVGLLWLCPILAKANETSEKNTPIIGAGAHFTWIFFDEMKHELEALSGRKLELSGKGSVLGIGCNAGVKTALKNKPGYETFGFICCPLKKDELDEGKLKVYPMALEPVHVIVNKKNPVQDLSFKQVQDIFSGKIKNWQQVGGKDQAIVVIARLHCKDRHGDWKHILPTVEHFTGESLLVTGEEDMTVKVNDLENAIGHMGSAWDLKGQGQDRIKYVTVDKVKPTAENLKNKSYPYFRELAVITNDKPSEDLLKIIHYARTSDSFYRVAKKYDLLPNNKSTGVEHHHQGAMHLH